MTLFCGPYGKTSRWRCFIRGWSAGNHIIFLIHTLLICSGDVFLMSPSDTFLHNCDISEGACPWCSPSWPWFPLWTTAASGLLSAISPASPHTLPLANATTDFSLSLTFFICKVSVAVTTSLGGCENYSDSLMWYQPRWAPSRWQPSWGHRESDPAEHAAALWGLVLFLANTNLTLCSKPLIPQGVELDLIRCCTLHILGSG